MKYTEQILFVLSVGLVFWQAWGLNYDSYTNYRKGLAGVVFVIFVESILKGEILFFKRFSTFWRAILRVAMLYLCGLVFLAFQNEVDARQLLSHLYPDLGKPIPKSFHTYDDHCDLTMENFISDFDHYYAMHFIGWFIATLVVRDRYVMYVWQAYLEVLELSFQHILPHFAECWWDHVFTDILLSNIPSIELGLFVLKKLKWKKYDWMGRFGKTRVRDWTCLHSHRRFGAICQFVLVITVNFLCGFFMINSLWIPPTNPLNIFRLIIWFLNSNMSFRELYSDIETWGTYERIQNPVSGKARWITFFLCIAETFVSIKFLKDAGNWNEDFQTPIYIWLPWVLLITNCLVFYMYLRRYGESKQKYPAEYYRARDQCENKIQAKELYLIENMEQEVQKSKVLKKMMESELEESEDIQQQKQTKQKSKSSKKNN